MLEIRTQSMDTNFYPNIELGGKGRFFPTFETKVVARFLPLSRVLVPRGKISIRLSCTCYARENIDSPYYVFEFYITNMLGEVSMRMHCGKL